jgi:hypothetical protein
MRTNIIFSRIFALLVVVALSLFGPNIASAQDQGRVGITVSPPVIEDRVEPGAVVSYSLKIENKGDATEMLIPKLYDISGISKNGQPEFSGDKGESQQKDHELSSWVTFDTEKITLPPLGSAILNFTVHVPNPATPGSHIGTVSLTQDAPTGIKMGTGVGYEVRSILSLRVAGDVIEKARIREFFANQSFFTKPDVHFVISIQNEGNVFSRPKGFIDITNMMGNKVETLPVNDGLASVFPMSDREFTADWKSDSFHIGKYRAEMTLTVEGAQGFQSLLSSVEFWVIPTDVVLPVLGGLLFFLVAFWVLLRLYVRKQIRRATGGRVTRKERDAASLSKISVVVIGLLISVIIGLILLLFLLG